MKMRPATRRQFLRTMSAVTLGGASGFAANLAAFNAFAADTSGYKALVCVFLFGGQDNHDTVIPYDQAGYNEWADKRQPLIGQFNGARARGALLPLTGADLGGREFAMAPELAPLHQLFVSGQASVVGNVGPLVEPLTRETFRDDSGRRPPRLFSHNDQQSIWMASEPEGAQRGWGGRLGDMVLAGNQNATFTAVSVAGNAVFLTGDQVRQFQVDRNGANNIRSATDSSFLGSSSLPYIMNDHFRDFQGSLSSFFQQDLVNARRVALDANAELEFALEQGGEQATPKPANNSLADQLFMVGDMIAQRNLLGVNRQVFFVSTGGFDTHSDQASNLPNLHNRVASAMRAFYDYTVELGVQDLVTAFTASDFGRTLQVNGDGTDHGWGGHHLVVGGAVNGGQILGDIPPAVFDHSQDSGRGRLIPSVAVDQYAASLGRWFGLTEGELTDALPGLENFDRFALDGLFSGVV